MKHNKMCIKATKILIKGNYILAPLFRTGLYPAYQPTKQRILRREVDKFRAVGYIPVYKLSRV